MPNVCEDGVLKLVHPGRFVEIHRRPMVAAEVMAKNPRHFVTRTDVFKFPMVVRPEAVLKPGSIYFIVPYHTLYRLLHSSNPSHGALVRPPHHDRPTSPCHCKRPTVPAVDPWAADNTVKYSSMETFVGRDQATRGTLKSCLKKRSSVRSRERRVAFNLPEDQNENRGQGLLMVDGDQYCLGF